MAIAVLASIFVLIRCFPKTQIGRFLQSVLIDRLADRLNALTMPRIRGLASLAFLGLALLLLSKGQASPLLAQVGAEAVPWFLSFDLLPLVEVMAAVSLLRLAVRFARVVYGTRVIAAAVSSYRSKIVDAFSKNLGSQRRARLQRKAGRSRAHEDDSLSVWLMHSKA